MTRTTQEASSDPGDVEAELHTLLLRGLDGEHAAYQAFLHKLSAHLRAFLRRRLFGWPDDVEDLVQECLLAMHNKRNTYQPDQPLTAWVHAIARYKLIDLLRSKSGREALHVPLDDDVAVFAESSTDASDARRDLAGLLGTLPDRQRLPIEQVKLNGLSVTEAAALLGMSESAIKVGIHRGLKALGKRVGGSS
ncbi:MAG: sigma-70 family RNA polymerase sigma factor [Burkholderiaceae bacterium]